MRVKRLHIDGFGICVDKSFPLSERFITVIHGPQETGKTTLMEFIRTVLFGFKGKAKEFYPPLAGGEHGGRIEIVSDAGEEFTFHRTPGRNGGPLVVTSVSDGREISDKKRYALCGHLDRATFETVFAFDEDDLKDLPPSDDSSDVTSRIYSAGIGTEQLENTLKDLTKKRTDLYTKSGRGDSQISRVLTRLKELEGKLRSVKGQAEEYNAACRGLDELDEQIKTTNRKLEDARLRHEEQCRYQKAWPEWVELQNVEEELSQYSIKGQFPVDPIEQLRKLEKDIEDQEDVAEKVRAKHSEITEKVQLPIDGRRLIDEAVPCESIHSRKESYAGAVVDVKTRERECAEKESNLKKALKALGPDWSEERVNQFNLSLPARSELKDWQGRLKSQEEEQTEITVELSRRVRECEEAAEAAVVARANAEQNSWSQNTVDELDRKIELVKSARGAYSHYDAKQEQLKNLEEKLKDDQINDTKSFNLQMLIGGIGVVVALILSMLSFAGWLNGYLLGGAAIVSVLVLGLLTFLVRSRKWPQSQDSTINDLVKDAKKSTNDAKNKYAAVLQDLGYSSDDVDDVDESKLDRTDTRLTEARRLDKDLRSAESLLKMKKQWRSESVQRQERQQSEREAENIQWSKWLDQQRLPNTLRVDAVEKFCDKIEKAQLHSDNVTSWKKRIFGIGEIIRKFEEDVNAVASRHSDLLDTSQSDVALLAQQIANKLQEAQTAVTTRESQLERKGELTGDLENAEAKLGRLKEKRDKMLAAGQSTSVENFEQKAKDFVRFQDLEEQQNNLRTTLSVYWNRQYDASQLSRVFRSTTKEAVDREIKDLASQIKDLEVSRSTQEQDQGGLKAKIDGLEGYEQASKPSHLRAQREEFRAELRDLAEQWSRVVIAQSLLERAKSKYEEERQPDVVRHAKTWFADMTGGRYHNIYVGVGNKRDISVVDQSGLQKTADKLSGGTKNQLYLAFRLGLIHSHGEQDDEKMPVVVDDALVRCDPTRAAAAVDIFMKLAQTNQVLVLTCHPWVVDLFKQASGKVEFVPM